MKKVKKSLSLFIVMLTFIAIGSFTEVASQSQIIPEDCVNVLSVRCPYQWGDCCYVSSADFNCAQIIC